MFTRQDYLNASNNTNAERVAAHRKYYAQFVNPRTIAFVVNWIGADKLKASTDPHMNDIPLGRWDRMVNMLPLAIRHETVGDYYTLGNCVCIAKEAARQWLEANPPTKSPD
jgi:hypothetical protein